ncbi:MAG TPA: FGGY-family carbohydrate kinase [Aggregatilinea sp.]|uniref:xylulokinase n=1 Tax=Aggregatilinea sp. TaxID=2806333 RepID=UPI002BB99D3F|nr:FGGY-family carbohydrate kinase [Aggregatilinea sp.]HML20248.1 FGGY-family carbohydrate kinase [Aggregatilinea sp.]
MTNPLVLVHDVGTTGSKSCLYRLGERLELVGMALEEYPLYVLDNGGVEQDPDHWWAAICRGTRAVLEQAQVAPAAIQGVAFCAQMQGFIPVDENGTALHRAMSYMDSRGTAQYRRYMQDGPVKIERMNAVKLLASLRITGGASASVKDPVWKYLWLRDERPEIFRAMRYWMDVKDYLVARCTGRFTFGYDSAHATFLFDTRPGKLTWHEGLCRTYDVNPDHLPPVVWATDQVGGLTAQAAEALGLPEGVPVFGGGGDLTLISLGSGSLDTNATHIYIGTSGWVCATVDRRRTDINGMVASILAAVPGQYNYISEQETSGRCLQWIRDHLALDEIGVYLEQKTVADKEEEVKSLYDYLGEAVEQAEPGANGVIFTPWMHGNRSPFEDPYARGIFFNLSLQTGKRDLIRAVLEGDAYHKRWMLETVEKQVPRNEVIRLVGGGARSDTWGQILADVTGRTIEVTKHPENAGAAGAALVCGVGLGVIRFEDVRRIIHVAKTFTPRAQYKALYDKQYRVYRQLHKQNRKLFKLLNA